MFENILIITPLLEEYHGLYDSLTALGFAAQANQIGRLKAQHFPALHITLAQGGHGKTQFGIQTQYLLDHARFDLVICAGAAGALAAQVHIGDLVVVTKIIEHDYNNKFSVKPKPQFDCDSKTIEQLKAVDMSDADFKVHFGVMAGGDEDVVDIARGAELRDLHDALAVAWEGVGGARACAFNEVPYLELRGATDTANHEAPVVFDVNLKIVMKNIAALFVQWLK